MIGVSKTKSYVDLFEYCVKHNLASIVEMAVSYINLDCYISKYPAKYYGTKGIKLIKIIKEENDYLK